VRNDVVNEVLEKGCAAGYVRSNHVHDSIYEELSVSKPELTSSIVRRSCGSLLLWYRVG
jgi:hypothetical protein